MFPIDGRECVVGPSTPTDEATTSGQFAGVAKKRCRSTAVMPATLPRVVSVMALAVWHVRSAAIARAMRF